MIATRSANPKMSADDVIEAAKSGGMITRLGVTLTTVVHGALSKYAESEGTTIDDAAGMLIREGLYTNDFLEESE